MKKNLGFILHSTILCLLISLGIFSLFSFVIKNSIDFNSLEKKSKIHNLDITNTYSTALYEFFLIDSYIRSKKIENKEEYIFTTSSNEKLWNYFNDYSKTSIGGFSINTLIPNPKDLQVTGLYNFKIDFLKKITLVDNNDLPFLLVYIYTTPISLSCSLDKENYTLLCDDSSVTINNFRILGEVLKNENN